LVEKVILSVYQTEAGMAGALTGGSIQAAEWAFSTGVYTSLGTDPNIIESSTTTSSWFGMAFNYLKFPGNNINFRRAIQFLQDYTYIQTTILAGVEGTATPDVLPCVLYAAACNTVPMSTYYSFDTLRALKELCLIPEITSTDCPVGPITAATFTCTAAGVTANSNVCASVGATFSPNLWRRTSHHRDPWGARTSFQGSTIGLIFNDHLISAAGGPCFTPNALEVITPGVYNAGTGYNSAPVTNATAIVADHCDIYTLGFISSVPAFNGNLDLYNSQNSGNPTNTGNYYDDATLSTIFDGICNGGGCPAVARTLLNNIDYTSNQVRYATTPAAANTAAINFATPYALQLPTVVGFFENTLSADNANGWTSFAGVANNGPNELAGAYYTLLNVHQCGSATCTLGAVNGGTLGGTFNYALQNVADASGINPTYNTNWVWQADVYQMIYDSPLTIAPTDFTNVNAFTNYLTNSFSVTNFASTTTGIGGTWFYFQQPCGNAASIPPYSPTPACVAKAYASPGPHQKGAGLTVAQRTIANGAKVIFNFKHPIYFTDGIAMTANDFVFSLDFFNFAASPNYASNASPASGLLGGSAGLIAAHRTGLYQVELYLGSQSVWNLGTVPTIVLPFHIWRYFNPDHVSTFAFGTVDTTLPFDSAATAFSTSGAPAVPAASWMHWLNNLAIGNGAFWLKSWDTPTGTGEIDRNPSYFNPNWQAMAADNLLSGPTSIANKWGFGISIDYPNTTPSPKCTVVDPCWTFDFHLDISLHNPTAAAIACGPSTPGPIAPAGTGMCQLMGTMAGVSWAAVGAGKCKVFDSTGLILERSLTLSKNVVSGKYFCHLPGADATKTGVTPCGVVHVAPPYTGCYTLPPGAHKLVIDTTYVFHGQLRHWFQAIGFSTP